MTAIHLLGCDGFIGKAVQREACDMHLHCWSHGRLDYDHFFDLLNPSTWQALIDMRPKKVILLSWPGLPNYQESFHVNRNLPACIDLLDSLVEAGLQRLVVAGTCFEYGLQNGPLKESQFTDPVNSYSIAKDCLRRVICTRYKKSNLQWCWARIFYPIGEGQNPNSLLPSLIKALELGETSFPMGSGRQLRDFIPVEQVASHLLKLATHPDAMGIYNVGSGLPRSVLEIVEDVIESRSGTISLKKGFYPDRSDEPLAFWADMTKIINLI